MNKQMKITYANTLVITIHFDNNEQIGQLGQHLQTYNITDLGTLLNLIVWAEGRGMLVDVNVRRRWSLVGVAMWMVVNFYRRNAQVRAAIPPEKY